MVLYLVNGFQISLQQLLPVLLPLLWLLFTLNWNLTFQVTCLIFELLCDLSRSLDEIRPAYQFDETCQGTVPQAITAFLESTDFEDAI